MQKPKHIEIGLAELMTLLNSVKVAEESPHVGVCGPLPYSALVAEIDAQSTFVVTPDQLEHMIWTYKQAVLNKLVHNYVPPPNYNELIKALSKRAPKYYKTSKIGEVSLHDFAPEEDKIDERGER